MTRRQRARRLTAEAARLLDTDLAAAEATYRQALEIDPTVAEAWFDLGLIGKWTRRWELALDANLRSLEHRGARADDPAQWNLGIAATALHRWDIARRAWAAYGIPPFDGDGEIDGDLGPCPIRLNPDDDGEVVWAQRIDPARARLVSVPLPESGHRWGDIVLHDGAPNGYRMFAGRERAVFDELERWAPSDVPTVEVLVEADAPDAIDALLKAFESSEVPSEDWTRTVEIICKACSEGRPYDREHEHPPDPIIAGPHRIGVAAPIRDVETVVEAWHAAGGRSIHHVEIVC